MKKYRVTVHCEDIIAIVLADNEDDAEQKYWDGKIEEYEESWQQPGIYITEVH